MPDLRQTSWTGKTERGYRYREWKRSRYEREPRDHGETEMVITTVFNLLTRFEIAVPKRTISMSSSAERLELWMPVVCGILDYAPQNG